MQSEQDILALISEGDHSATLRVYKQHAPTIIHWIGNLGGSNTDAEDVFQEAMMILFEHAQRPEFRLTCRIGTYLFAISKHIWYKRLNRANRMPTTSYDGYDEDADTNAAYEDDIATHEERELHYEQLTMAMEKIGEPCRGLLKAFYNDGKSMVEIAKAFNYTNPDNAKTQKYKCLTRLKKIFFATAQRVS